MTFKTTNKKNKKEYSIEHILKINYKHYLLKYFSFVSKFNELKE
jgi:hypothetical protein